MIKKHGSKMKTNLKKQNKNTYTSERRGKDP